MRKRSSVGMIFAVVFAVAVILVVGFVGVRKMQQRAVEQQVMAALAIDDLMARMQAFVRLRDAQDPEVLAALVQALDDPDVKTHSRAGSELSLFHDKLGNVVPTLAAHVKSSPYPDVRLACVVVLMSNRSPEVHDAYLHALHDSSNRVVEIVCMELPERAEKGDAEALYAVLDHPSWRVRLAICKALILMKKADKRVVSTLEAMSQDPEATNYDTEIDEMDEDTKKAGLSAEEGAHWGKLSTILQQARDIAAKG